MDCAKKQAPSPNSPNSPSAYLPGGDGGLDRRYRELRSGYPQQVTEETLNRFGYYLLFDKLAEPAVWLLKLNVKHFPRSANAHDSLGEAYLAAGNRRLAVRHYRRSLVLDPKNENAANILKKLESK